MSEELTNEQRADIGLRALLNVELSTMCREDLEDSIVDLVTNLMHLAQQKTILDPDHILHRARMHFKAEMQEEGE